MLLSQGRRMRSIKLYFQLLHSTIWWHELQLGALIIILRGAAVYI